MRELDASNGPSKIMLNSQVEGMAVYARVSYRHGLAIGADL